MDEEDSLMLDWVDSGVLFKHDTCCLELTNGSTVAACVAQPDTEFRRE